MKEDKLDYAKMMKLNRIFHKSCDELLLEDYKNLPHLRNVIKIHLDSRDLKYEVLTE